MGPIYGSVNFSFEVDSIISHSQSNDVTVLVCDGSVKKCCGNTFGNKLLCFECRRRTASVLSKISNIRIIKQKEVLKKKSDHKSYYYHSLKDLNKVVYRDFEIGYGVSSYYISLTRNLNPRITPKLKRILDDWLEISMTHADIADSMISSEYDCVYVINGRLFDSKPYQEIAFARGKHVILGESCTTIDGRIVRMLFDNVRVHSVAGNSDNIRHFWDSSVLSIEERRSIASSFYEKRANAIKTNDKVYISGQKQGVLPDDWDASKINIAIFNSSEDEFAAIGGEFEKNNLFGSQLEGIKFLLENIKDNSIHFYLRIHPNLMNIHYKYHTDLYKLPKQYSNVTVIPGDSPVSSYSLMKSCDRLITFGSTMGVEAAYAGKEAMVMRPCFYYYLDVNYVPKTKEDVLDFVSGKVGYTPSLEDALKYSYYYYNNERQGPDNSLCLIKRQTIKFMKREYSFDSMNLNCSNQRMIFCAFLDLLGVYIAKKRIPKREY